jgi:hypothetical protein
MQNMDSLQLARNVNERADMTSGTGVGTWMRGNGLHFALEVVANFVLPLVIYDQVSPRHGDFNALLASMAPPMLWSLVEFARTRRVDALSVLVLVGIGLSLLAAFGGGDARLLQLRENVPTAIIGLAFLCSAAIGRPLIYLLAHAALARKSPEEFAAFECERDSDQFRRAMMVMTLVWGAGLIASALLSVALIFELSIHHYLIVSPILGYGTMGALALWTVLYNRRAPARADAEPASCAP